MDIKKTLSGSEADLQLSGRLDAFWSEHFNTELDGVLHGGYRLIRLEMSELSYISSAGLRVLVKAHRRLKEVDGGLAITNPSENVLKILKLAGFESLLDKRGTTDEKLENDQNSQADGDTFLTNPSGTFILETAGEFDLSQGDFSDLSNVSRLEIGRDTFAIGVGALGEKAEECRELFGDFLAVGGNVVYLPSNEGGVPDFIQGNDNFKPSILCLNYLRCEGRFSTGFYFENKDDSFLPFSSLCEDILNRIDEDSAAVLLIAETTGLVGASLAKSPTQKHSDESIFDFPNVRDWLAFCPEKQYGGQLAVIFGIVSRLKDDHRLKPLLRPLSPDRPDLFGRCNAAPLSFRLVRRGEANPIKTLDMLFEEEKIYSILRLINDDRDIVGAGESEFSRGCCWAAPLRFPEK